MLCFVNFAHWRTFYSYREFLGWKKLSSSLPFLFPNYLFYFLKAYINIKIMDFLNFNVNQFERNKNANLICLSLLLTDLSLNHLPIRIKEKLCYLKETLCLFLNPNVCRKNLSWNVINVFLPLSYTNTLDIRVISYRPT